MRHPFFTGIDWKEVYERRLTPPIPDVKKIEPRDISASVFADCSNLEHENNIPGWSFVKSVVANSSSSKLVKHSESTSKLISM
jgi:hypothetical protein